VLDIGQDVGALIVHCSEELHGREIEVSPQGNAARRTHTEVLARKVGTRTVFAAVFPALVAGPYSLWRDVLTDQAVTIAGGAIVEVDWLHVRDADDFRLAQPEGASLSLPLSDDPALGWGPRVPAARLAMLPPRYRQGEPVSAAPMGAAPMRYADDGTVAWDQMWTAYCDLALAGGPKHRATLLEPATAEEALADEDAYEVVVGEIERGLRLVTGLPTVRAASPGWVGLQCPDEVMARWMLRAIAEENVSVRREGIVLFLPAAPAFRLDKEIKNVITVVAKTHHYWQEHRDG
jgi:hypothetical protein